MRTGKKYTEDELLYLESSWGKMSVARIAGKLGRTVEAIESKARKMGLGDPLECKDFMIAVEVADLLGTDRKTLKKHFEDRGLKYKYRKIKNRKLIAVEYEDLIEWLIENPNCWNGTKVDKIGLISIGLDRDFLSNKIKEDEIKICRTTLEEKDAKKIAELYKKFYTYEQIAKVMNKDYQTVKWKIHTMIKDGVITQNTKEGRIVRSVNRENYGWQEWQDRVLIKEFKNGKTLKEISEMVGKSLGATKSRNQILTRRIIKGLAV